MATWGILIGFEHAKENKENIEHPNKECKNWEKERNGIDINNQSNNPEWEDNKEKNKWLPSMKINKGWFVLGQQEEKASKEKEEVTNQYFESTLIKFLLMSISFFFFFFGNIIWINSSNG